MCDGEVFVRTYLVGRQGVIEALQATTPLRAELASVGNQPEYPIELPGSTSVASVSSPALIRVTRPMGEPTTAEKTQPQGQVAIRLYVSNANGTEVPVQVTMPVLTNASTPAAALVTALEEPISGAAALSFNNVNELTVPTKSAVITGSRSDPRMISDLHSSSHSC